MINKLRYSLLRKNAKPPFRKNPTDAGIDFYSCESVVIPSQSMTIVHTGVAVEIPEGFFLLIKPKGRNDHLIGAGVVDAFYHPGEILVKVANIGCENLEIKSGEAIAQGIFIPIETPVLEQVPVEELQNQSARSKKGGIVDQQ